MRKGKVRPGSSLERGNQYSRNCPLVEWVEDPGALCEYLCRAFPNPYNVLLMQASVCQASSSSEHHGMDRSISGEGGGVYTGGNNNNDTARPDL